MQAPEVPPTLGGMAGGSVGGAAGMGGLGPTGVCASVLSFADGIDSPVDSSYAIAAGDVNSDGKIDVAVTSGQSAALLAGKGDGNLGVPVLASVGNGAKSIALGRIDGDSSLDAVVVHQSDKSVSILLAKGGALSAGSTLPINAGAWTVALADLDNDGHLDLLVPDDSNALQVLLGVGDGTFGSVTPYVTGLLPSCAASGDFDGDSKTDVVVANSGVRDVSFFHGNDNGTLEPPTTWALDELGAPIGLAAVDLDGDGKLDVLALSQSGNSSLELLKGHGDGTFDAPVLRYLGLTASSFAVADFDGDFRPDVAVATESTTLMVYVGRPGGALVNVWNTKHGLNAHFGIAAGDFDGDGAADFASTSLNDGFVSVFLSNCLH